MERAAIGGDVHDLVQSTWTSIHEQGPTVVSSYGVMPKHWWLCFGNKVRCLISSERQREYPDLESIKSTYFRHSELACSTYDHTRPCQPDTLTA